MKISILQRGPKSFRLRIETKDAAGRRHHDYESFSTRAEAEARKAAILANPDAEAPSTAPTLTQAFDAYVTEAEALKILSGSSAGQYRIAQKLYLGDLAGMHVDRITQDHVRAHLIGLAGRLGAPTLRALRAKISRVIRHQIDAGSASKNPCAGVTLAKIPASAGKALLPQELDNVLEACKVHKLGPIIRFALATGMRRGEICGLRWKDIDLKRGVVHVRSQVHLERDDAGALSWTLSDDLKTEGSSRDVGIPASVVADLAVLKAEAEAWAGRAKKPVDGLLVFLNDKGRAWSPNALTEAVGRFMKRLGLTQSIHDLRHTHATLLLRARHNPKAVSKRLGHSRVETTLSIYSHALPSDDAGLTAEAGSIVDGGI
jgi:integrase